MSTTASSRCGPYTMVSFSPAKASRVVTTHRQPGEPIGPLGKLQAGDRKPRISVTREIPGDGGIGPAAGYHVMAGRTPSRPDRRHPPAGRRARRGLTTFDRLARAARSRQGDTSPGLPESAESNSRRRDAALGSATSSG